MPSLATTLVLLVAALPDRISDRAFVGVVEALLAALGLLFVLAPPR